MCFNFLKIQNTLNCIWAAIQQRVSDIITEIPDKTTTPERKIILLGELNAMQYHLRILQLTEKDEKRKLLAKDIMEQCQNTMMMHAAMRREFAMLWRPLDLPEKAESVHQQNKFYIQ